MMYSKDPELSPFCVTIYPNYVSRQALVFASTKEFNHFHINATFSSIRYKEMETSFQLISERRLAIICFQERIPHRGWQCKKRTRNDGHRER